MEPFDFSQINESDGWKINAIERECYCSLSMELHVNVEPQPIGPDGATFITLYEWTNPTPAAKADYALLRRLFEAICRYFNGGGSWTGIDLLMENMPRHAVGALHYAGWHYHDLRVNGDGMYQHVFISATEPAKGVVWIENIEISEPEPWDDVENRLYYGKETGGTETEEEHGQGRLQLGGDFEEAEAAG